ncbi:hypothetical protein EI94DRAFT_1747017 [Lactarius quietus]|nr:hypothetical protein EI94DRAFT_1747017 [Lactarius quietus]
MLFTFLNFTPSLFLPFAADHDLFSLFLVYLFGVNCQPTATLSFFPPPLPALPILRAFVLRFSPLPAPLRSHRDLSHKRTRAASQYVRK